MKEKRDLIKKTVKNCVARMSKEIPEDKVDKLVDRLESMNDMKTIVDSLAITVDDFFGKEELKKEFEECLEDLYKLGGETYGSAEEIKNQLKENKNKNYTPGDISVKENHKLIENSLKILCDKLNELGVDYYLVGALATFIGTKTPLFRYHGDIDFMVAEKDLEKVKQTLQGTEYEFFDNRLDNKKSLENGVGHTQGEHEVIANNKFNEFHLGFFLFRREKDESITIREYFMDKEKNGKEVPMVLERNCLKELVDLEYTSEETEFAGTKFKTSTIESVYVKKMYTKTPKDMLDIEVLKDKIDEKKITEMKKYPTTLKVVNPKLSKSVLESAIDATEQSTIISEINEQARSISKEKVVEENFEEKGR